MAAIVRSAAGRRLGAALLFSLCAALPLRAQNEPLLLVADLEYSGVGDRRMKLLVDLLSYMIFENGSYQVMNRYERNKLLRGFGYGQTNLNDRAVYLEAAELLRARYIVTGSLLPAAGGVSLSLSLWDVDSGALVKTASFGFPGFTELVAGSREVIEGLIGKPETAAGGRTASGLSETLYVTRIRERILVALPDPPLDETAAAARLLTADAAARLNRDERFSISFTSVSYDTARPDPGALAPVLAARDCHSLALVAREKNDFFLRLYNPDDTVRLELPLSFRLARSREAERFEREFRETVSPFPAVLLAAELEREIEIKEKLDTLLFNEKFLARRFTAELHTSTLKPALAGIYQPLLNILSIEADAYWYYGRVFGIGVGYAFSLGYPATIDNRFASCPLIRQHEFRFIPLSFRTPGQISILFNFITALNLQNAYRIDTSGPDPAFTDETPLLFFKTAINMGLCFSVNDDVSVTVDLATLCYIFPLNQGTMTNTGTNFSGAFGGLGVMVRF
ncbi:MAG: hypothetical protein JXD23_06545 [Spirochaetales bacterium]|nr:hypothetical protein [Spirochaetales bacterium]